MVADGSRTLILKSDTSSCITCLIIIEIVLQGKILHIQAGSGIQNRGGFIDTLHLNGWCITDNRIIHTLTYQ